MTIRERITQWILGIRPTYSGLKIAPVIPQDWPGFKVTRLFRGVTYHILVERAGPGNTLSLTVNGRPVGGNIIPLSAGERSEVAVKAILF